MRLYLGGITMVVYHLNETKAQKIKREIKEKFQNIWYWISDNKELLVVVVPVFVGALTTILRVSTKAINNHNEKQLKELYCYDRSLGHYWKLRRPLRNSEWVEIEQRRKQGERLADILSELRVLK